MTTYQVLAALVAALAEIPHVTTCRLGLEEGLTADDYPLIRVVLSETRDSEQGNPFKPLMGILVYYGELAQPFEAGGIAAQYEWLMDMEHAIKTALIPTGKGWRAHWIETVFDEDRLPGFKLFASRFEVWGF